MPWNKSGVFREWLNYAFAPVPGFTGGWNLPATRDFRCCLFRDNIDTTDAWPGAPGSQPPFPPPGSLPGEAERDSLLGTCLSVNAADRTSRWELHLSIGGQGAATPPGEDHGGWRQGGEPIPGTGQGGGYVNTGGVITFGGGNVTSTREVTWSGVHGDFVFDINSYGTGSPGRPLPYQGLAFHWFGGPTEVENGTYTVVWPVERVAQIQFVDERFPNTPRSVSRRRRAVV